jgi:DNA-binding response OmpR family regulator
MNESQSTLLIVDDEPSCREAFRMALEDEYRLVEADSDDAALDILRSGEYIDLMLLDYMLPPAISGLEMIHRMKRQECTLPVILVTGKVSEKVAVKAFRMEVQDYISKPITVGELREAIRGIIGPIQGKSKPVDDAVAFMEKQYSRPLFAQDEAEAIQVSYDHLAHLFKAETGYSIHRWLNILRIDKAKILHRDSRFGIRYAGLE